MKSEVVLAYRFPVLVASHSFRVALILSLMFFIVSSFSKEFASLVSALGNKESGTEEERLQQEAGRS